MNYVNKKNTDNYPPYVYNFNISDVIRITLETFLSDRFCITVSIFIRILLGGKKRTRISRSLFAFNYSAAYNICNVFIIIKNLSRAIFVATCIERDYPRERKALGRLHSERDVRTT